MIRKLHRRNAYVLGLFIAVHLLNHLVLLIGIDAHIAVMHSLRKIYRFPGIEQILLVLFIIQAGLGLTLALHHGKPKGRWAWIQVSSGLYIIFFLVQHVPAVLLARITLDLDTTIWFAASVVNGSPERVYFAPYYTLAVLAVFAHIGAAMAFRGRKTLAKYLIGIGVAWGALVTGTMLGIGQLPAPYQTYIDNTFGWMHSNG